MVDHVQQGEGAYRNVAVVTGARGLEYREQIRRASGVCR